MKMTNSKKCIIFGLGLGIAASFGLHAEGGDCFIECDNAHVDCTLNSDGSAEAYRRCFRQQIQCERACIRNGW